MTHQTPRCTACHRPLKRPSPTGLGPVCERRFTGPPPARPALHRPADGTVPGQAELPLYDHQPTLWSL